MAWKKRSPRRRPFPPLVERSPLTTAKHVFRCEKSGKITLVCFSVSLLLLFTFSTTTAQAILEEAVYNVHLWVTPQNVSASAAAAAAENARLLGRIILRRQLQDAPEMLHLHSPQQKPKTPDRLQQLGSTVQQKAAGTIIPPPQSAASVSNLLQRQHQQREEKQQSAATAAWLSYADEARAAVLEEYRIWVAAQERETYRTGCVKPGRSRSSDTAKHISPTEFSTDSSIAARETPACEEYSASKESSSLVPAPLSKLFPLLSLRISRAATTEAAAADGAVSSTSETELMTSIPLSMLLSQSESLLLQTGQQQQHRSGDATSPSSSLVANLLRWIASFFARPLQLPEACAQAPFLLSLHLSPVSLLPFSISVQRVVDVLGAPSAAEAFQLLAAADADIEVESSSSNRLPPAATTGATAAEPTSHPVSAASRRLFLKCQSSISTSSVKQEQHHPLAEESSPFSKKSPAPALQLLLPPLLGADPDTAGAWVAPGFFPRELDFAAASGILSQQLQQKQEAAGADSSDQQQQQQPFWRRYWWLLLAAFMVLTAVGGGGPQAADERSGTAATEQRQQQRPQQPSSCERGAAGSRAAYVRQRSRPEKKR